MKFYWNFAHFIRPVAVRLATTRYTYEYNMGLTHPTVSSILERMEERGMICTEQLPSDRRYKKIIPTEKAIGCSEMIHQKMDKIISQVFDGITADQEAVLNTAVKK